MKNTIEKRRPIKKVSPVLLSIILIVCLITFVPQIVSGYNTQAPNNGDEQYRTGKDFFDKKDYTNAFKWFEKSALQKNSDPDEVMSWFEKSALQGNADGQYHMGRKATYARNYTEGLKWYKKSAEQGFKEAQDKLK